MFEQTEVLAESGEFALRLLGDVRHADVFLTIDIYDLDNPVHPAGHVGWWRFPVEELGERISGRLHVRRDGADVSLADVASEDRWINETPVRPSRGVVNAVLRTKSANSIVALDQIPAFASVQDRSEFRSRFNRDWRVPRFASPHYVPPPRSTVRIVSQSIRLHDAVGNLCLDLYRMLRQSDFAVEMYAERFDLELNDVVRPVRRLSSEVGKDDYVLYFFSIFDKYLKDVLGLTAARKIAYFHGVTPPKLLQVFDPELSVACTKALAQLPELAGFDVLAANSSATAQDLIQSFAEGHRHVGKVNTIAPCLSSKRAYPEANRSVGGAHARLLYVGQLRSHKRVEHLLELFAAYRSSCPDAECWIVGAEPDAAYRAYLGWVEHTQLGIPPGHVHWLGKVSDEKLQTIYRSASVYVSMSEHEGFCLPVLEAMAAGLPVISYAQPAIQEVLGGSGITFFDKGFARLAEHLRALLDTPDRLAEIVARQQDRAAVLMRNADGMAFWRLLAPDLPHGSKSALSAPAITGQLP
jgi:glycosyltransferase involved in cell wall biosynthesis